MYTLPNRLVEPFKGGVVESTKVALQRNNGLFQESFFGNTLDLLRQSSENLLQTIELL